jgi:Nucleoside-diphosphate-sugar epimerases
MDNKTVCILEIGRAIGSHLLRRVLSTMPCRVIGIDLSSSKIGPYLSDEKFTFVKADIFHTEKLKESIEKSDVVISLAAMCNPSLYTSVPLRVIESNFTQPLEIAALCTTLKKRLIHFSTCEVYGRTRASYAENDLSASVEPFNEDDSPFVLGPVRLQRWTYACAKQLHERVIYAYGFESGLKFTIIRPFNFIGPRMDFIPGIDGVGLPRVIACFMEALLFNKPLRLVDGGKSRRCFTYIDDALDAIMAIIQRPEKAGGQIFNVGNPGNECTIAELARRMACIYKEVTNDDSGGEIDIVDVSSGQFYGIGYDDSDRRVPDISKAKKLLNWSPSIGLDEALARTIRAYIDEYGNASKKAGFDTSLRDTQPASISAR